MRRSRRPTTESAFPLALFTVTAHALFAGNLPAILEGSGWQGNQDDPLSNTPIDTGVNAPESAQTGYSTSAQ